MVEERANEVMSEERKGAQEDLREEVVEERANDGMPEERKGAWEDLRHEDCGEEH